MPVVENLTVTKVAIRVNNNEDLAWGFRIGVAGDTSWTLAGMVARLQIRAEERSPDVLLDCSADNGRLTVVSESNREYALVVPWEDLDDLAPGVYPFDMILEHGAGRSPVMRGTVELGQGVTRW